MGSFIYRVIHKSLREFRPLRYSSRNGDAEGEHVNRGRDTPIFPYTFRCSICPPLVTRQMSILQIPRHRKLSCSLSAPCFVTTAS